MDCISSGQALLGVPSGAECLAGARSAREGPALQQYCTVNSVQQLAPCVCVCVTRSWLQLCQLLSAVPPSYKFSARDLQQLAAAAAALDPSREHLLRLNKNLLAKAQAAAGAGPPAWQASSASSAAAAKRGNHGGDDREGQERHGGQTVEL